MVLKYKLAFNADSSDYAARISDILASCPIESNVIKAPNEIIVFLNGDEEAIKDAFTALGAKLPLSIYLGEQEAEEVHDMPQNHIQFEKKWYMGLYPELCRTIVDEAHSDYMNLFSGNFAFLHPSISYRGVELHDANSIEKALDECILRLKNGECVCFGNEHETIEFSLNESKTVYITRVSEEISSRFGLQNAHMLALTSAERPFVALTHEAKPTMFCFANDICSLLLSKKAADTNLDALYMRPSTTTPDFFYRNCIGDVQARPIVRIIDGKTYISDVNKDKNDPVSSLRFHLSPDGHFGIFAQTDVQTPKKLLSALFFDSDIISEIRALSDSAGRLVGNVQKTYPELFTRIETVRARTDYVDTFFAATCALLSCKTFFDLISLADSADIPGGVKLDFPFFVHNGDVILDLRKTFTSMLSFKLAGVEDSTIAYSLFDSSVDFIIVALDEVKKGFALDELVIEGDFLWSDLFFKKASTKLDRLHVRYRFEG